ncbi:unnamed protein product [Acanthoscelides obtectus]|uniref:HTH psq-type domain-containing protein n=1 Tax=Acanthoscelides obtectus TaxID=200917 RepID=A0A9P0KQZ1_ACAOB|nr:unnamed protein product [Acanthoscelides obtectus]CAK1655789.1 Retrovirus-related Pol polyprotein from transposon 412 [Acanthoscelides obtectus]
MGLSTTDMREIKSTIINTCNEKFVQEIVSKVLQLVEKQFEERLNRNEEEIETLCDRVENLERDNRRLIMKMDDQEQMERSQNCYNSTRNKTTEFSPYELVFGHTSGHPPEHVYIEKELMSKYLQDIRNKLEYYYKIARSRTDEQKQKAKVRFDNRVSPNLQTHKIGDKVFVKQSQISNKLQNKFDGPYEVIQIMGEPNEKRNYGQWSEADVKAALNVFREGSIGFNEICRQYNIPKPTFRRHLKSYNVRANESKKIIGRSCTFFAEMEEDLEKHILTLVNFFLE